MLSKTIINICETEGYTRFCIRDKHRHVSVIETPGAAIGVPALKDWIGGAGLSYPLRLIVLDIDEETGEKEIIGAVMVSERDIEGPQRWGSIDNPANDMAYAEEHASPIEKAVSLMLREPEVAANTFRAFVDAVGPALTGLFSPLIERATAASQEKMASQMGDRMDRHMSKIKLDIEEQISMLYDDDDEEAEGVSLSDRLESDEGHEDEQADEEHAAKESDTEVEHEIKGSVQRRIQETIES